MTRRRSWFRRLINGLFWLLMLVVAVGATSVFSGRKLFDRLDEEIRQRAEREFASYFPQLHVTVGAARRKDDGLELERVVLTAPQDVGRAQVDQRPLVELERVIVRCQTDLANLAQEGVKPSSLAFFGVKIHIEADEDGNWALERLSPDCCEPTGDPIPIQVHDIRAYLKHPSVPPLTLVDMHAELLPLYLNDSTHAHWSLKLHKGAGASRMDIEGQVDPKSAEFVARCRAPRQEIRPSVLAFAKAMGLGVGNWRPRGVLRNIESTFWGGPQRALRYRLACDIVGARLENSDFPVPLDNVNAHLELDSQQFRISQAKASAAGAELNVRTLFWHFADERLNVEASLKGLRFDERVGCMLPTKLRQVWQEHEAIGEISNATWSLRYSQADGIIQNVLNMDWRDLSFQFPALPYRFHRASGTATLRGKRLAINLRAPVGGRTVQVVGDIHEVGTDESYGSLEMGTDGPVPLDEEMIAALSPQAQRLVRSFQPRGTLKLWGQVRRDGPGKPMVKRTVVRLENLAVNYERLPYPVNRIEGTLIMNDGDWDIDLKGRNDGAEISCTGDWLEQPQDRPHLQLRFFGRRVALDTELLQALPTSTRQLWREMQPRGTLDQVQVEFDYDALQRVSQTRLSLWKLPKGNAAMTTAPLSAYVPGLPYRLDNITGSVVFANGNSVLRNFRGVHGGAEWELDGTAFYERGLWRVDLPRLVVDNFVIDRDVLDCLPPQAATNLASLQVRGPLHIDGRLTVTGQQHGGERRSEEHSHRSIQSANWDMTVDVEKGSVRLGPVPINNIRGQVRMLGAVKQGRFAVNGELRVDSLQAKNATVYQLHGPVTMDNESIRFGAWATSNKARQIRARVFGGVAAGDAEYQLDGSQAFEVAATLSNGQLAELARRAVPVGGRVDGRAGATLVLSGTMRGIHTLKGEGYAEMTDAQIYDAPFMVNLLQLFARKPEPSLISNGNASFRIVGDRIYLDRMELEGAIRLKGKGEMTLDRAIDMTLYTAMRGRENDPSLMLFREASRRILEIQVAGTLEQPKITRRAFPELNDTLQRLFPETTPQKSVVSGLPRLRGRLTR